MKPAPFAYHAPGSLEEAIALLSSLEDSKVLAGGQSLVPLLNFRLARPAHLVDINRIPGLDGIYERDGGVAVQALVRHADALRSDALRRLCPLVPEALQHVAHAVIRNRGTVVGSIAHADPAAELPAVLLALEGQVVARGPRGERTIAAQDFFKGVLESALEPDEIAVEAWFPTFTRPHGLREESRRHGDYAMAGAVRAGERLTLFGVAPTPVVADPKNPTGGLQPSGDIEASPEFRKHLVEVLTQDLFAA
ncbi:MAG TPA: FAD binding domain-containing protein [Candidatus Dormibacteraeota bacterium]|jgi:carbon-monoxide dehydrogenase medium subunit